MKVCLKFLVITPRVYLALEDICATWFTHFKSCESMMPRYEWWLSLFNIWLLRMYGVTIFFSFIGKEIAWHFCYVKWHLPVGRIFVSEITNTHPKKSNGPRPLNSCLLSYQIGIFKPSIKWNAQSLKELTKTSSRLSDSKDDAYNWKVRENSYDTYFCLLSSLHGVKDQFLVLGW